LLLPWPRRKRQGCYVGLAFHEKPVKPSNIPETSVGLPIGVKMGGGKLATASGANADAGRKSTKKRPPHPAQFQFWSFRNRSVKCPHPSRLHDSENAKNYGEKEAVQQSPETGQPIEKEKLNEATTIANEPPA